MRLNLFAHVCALFLCVVGASPFASFAQSTNSGSSSDYITVQAKSFSPSLVAYGQVVPINLTPIAAAETGVVTGLKVRPGMQVRAGQALAHLSGPGISSLVLQNQADVRSAKAQLDAAEASLEIEQQQLLSHLTTRQAVQQAQSAVIQARTALGNAQSKQSATNQMMTLTAPASGIVLSLSSADGGLVSAGQTILTIQPAGALWLQAMYYGADLAKIHVGTTGTFAPADGGQPLSVRVVSIPGTLVAGGGETIALDATNRRSSWISGEFGTVILKLTAGQMVEVPTRALIVNQGKWWVLVHTAQGNHPQEVVPGPAEGWNTFIESGLAAGTQIVVNNAYLLFHSGTAEQYQIPD